MFKNSLRVRAGTTLTLTFNYVKVNDSFKEKYCPMQYNHASISMHLVVTHSKVNAQAYSTYKSSKSKIFIIKMCMHVYDIKNV